LKDERIVFFFVRSYDPERDYARMKASGVFKSLGMLRDFV